MEASVYETLLNLPELKVDRVEIQDKTISVFCHLKEGKGVCPVCQAKAKKVHQYTKRKVRDLDISGRQVYLIIQVRRFECEHCDRYFSEDISFAEPGKSYTKRQARWTFEMSAKQPLTESAALCELNAKTVERIFYENAGGQSWQRYEQVTQLGIDEFAFCKGKKDFIVPLVNLENGELVDVLPTREKQALIKHLKNVRLKDGSLFSERIQVLCCDFWGSFLNLGKTCFPNATTVADRFHWTAMLNNVLNDIRKSLRKQFPTQELFKNIKWLLFHQRENLKEQERKQLQKALALSDELRKAYELKDELTCLFNCHFPLAFGAEKVRCWIKKAKVVNQKNMNEFVEFLEKHFQVIVNYFKHPVSNSITEGKNNLLRTIKRFTFNMTNFEHFRARCFAFN